MARSEARYRTVEQRLWNAFSLSPRERFISLPSGRRVRTQEVGEGPPVIFVHGATNAGASWAPLLAHLHGVRGIVIDRPGCGLSDPVGGPRGLAGLDEMHAYADTLVRDVLDGLELESAAIGATSYGGLFALRGAAAYPGRISRVVEYSWPMGAPMDRVPRSLRAASIPGMERISARVPPNRPALKLMLRQIGLKAALAEGKFTDEMLDWFLSLLRETETMRNELLSSPKLFSPIAGLNQAVVLQPDFLARITAPVSLIWGSDDSNGGEAVARRFAAALPDATLHLLPGAGHAPWVDEPQTCARLTLEFLAG